MGIKISDPISTNQSNSRILSRKPRYSTAILLLDKRTPDRIEIHKDMSNNDNPANWPQELIDRINTLERKLDDYKGHIGANQNVKNEYFVALKKVAGAKEAIRRLAGTFN